MPLIADNASRRVARTWTWLWASLPPVLLFAFVTATSYRPLVGQCGDTVVSVGTCRDWAQVNGWQSWDYSLPSATPFTWNHRSCAAATIGTRVSLMHYRWIQLGSWAYGASWFTGCILNPPPPSPPFY